MKAIVNNALVRFHLFLFALESSMCLFQWAGQKYFETLVYAHTQALMYTGRSVLPSESL